MHNRFLLFLIGGIFFLTACPDNKKPSETEQTSVPAGLNVDSLRTQYQTLSDSLERTWQAIAQTDSGRYANMQRLLQEVSYTPRYDKLLFDSLKTQLAALPAKRYDGATFTSDQITQYDNAIDALLSGFTRLKASVPNVRRYGLISQLDSEISEANQVETAHRIDYDIMAGEINKLIAQHGAVLGQADPKLRNLKPRPLFSLSA